MKTSQAEIPNTLSLEALRTQLAEALRALMPDGTMPALCMEQLYPDRIIVRDAAGALWAYPYTAGADGTVTLGDRQPVTIAYVPAQQASARAGDVRMLQALDQQGWRWEVLILKPGLGANNQYFPEETLRQSAPVFEGARVFCLDDAQHSRTGDKSAKQIIGWIDQARYAAGQGLVGVLHLLPGADWLRQNLLGAREAGRPDLYGLSVDAPGEAVMKQAQEAGNRLVQWFTQIRSPATVDVVWNPGTPGGFQRALNAHLCHKEDPMKERLLTILQAKRPDLLAGKDQAALSEDEVLALYDRMLSDPARTAQAGGLSDEDRQTLRQARVLQWNGRAAARIADSKLPEVMQANLRVRFLDALPAEGTEQGLAQLQQAIEAERKVLDALSAAGKVQGLGYAHEVDVESEPERLQQAMDQLLGVKVDQPSVPAFVSIRQAYVRITGDAEVSGLRGHAPERLAKLAQAVRAMQAQQVDSAGYPLPGCCRVEQAQLSTSWPLLLGNSLYRRLRMEYAAVEYFESRIVSNRRRATDYRTLEAMTPHYPADLPTITEDNDYTEAAALSEEGVNYKVSKKGRILTITRETILNDDLGAITRMVRFEGRAARRTFARAVWNLLMSNATFDGDSKAIFHADHANLGSTALTANAAGVTALVAALNRLMNQTEPGSGEKLGGAWWGAQPMLVVPAALQDVAKQLNQSDGIPGTSNNGDNPVRGLFGAADRPERILVVPLFTDATDWYVLRQPTDAEMVEAAFLNGQEEPEVFVADQPGVGQMFLADKLQYKIRHEYGVECVDYRGMDKSVVAG